MTSPPNASASPDARVGLVAGNGALPYQVADVLANKGITPVIVAIKGEADPETLVRSVAELGWGEIGRLLKTLKRHGCSRLLLIGGISRRPDFASVFGDFGTLRLLPKITRALMGGDDSLLSKVIGLFEAEGFEVVGMTDIAPELLAGTGVLGKVSPSKTALEDMDLAFKATERLGELDIGQAAVAVGGRVVALEGAEGTDAMLERCAVLRANGRIRSKGAAGVLVKAAKPKQDLRVDLPTVGPRTIDLASAAGLAGIAVEAGRALIADQEATFRKADEAGLFIYGIERPEKD
ncbi:UDP-2,3-diacylglucosamine diphosphatase LpxI domain-containing protein [uncultured Roseibium sp.]|uniref:LpxI family protein n=1 Tax=uncultured Roseibium sp. TaxID=1936171 RepID=UPI003217EDCC